MGLWCELYELNPVSARARKKGTICGPTVILWVGPVGRHAAWRCAVACPVAPSRAFTKGRQGRCQAGACFRSSQAVSVKCDSHARDAVFLVAVHYGEIVNTTPQPLEKFTLQLKSPP
jgi:hypothetical protein